tara:strand:- start:62 stop:448 length:387 start_codon:yes stop_codon:yes gene_type:complete
MPGMITTLPVQQRQQPMHDTTPFGRGKLAIHSIACPCCSTKRITYSTNTRLSQVDLKEATKVEKPIRRRRRFATTCKACNGKGIVNVSFNGKNEIEKAIDKGISQDRLFALVIESVKALKYAISINRA